MSIAHKPGNLNGTRCACGGGCPRCGDNAPAALAGTRNEELAPRDSQPDPLTKQFGRWVGYTTSGNIKFNPNMNPQPMDKPFFRWNVNFQTSMELGTVVQKIESTWWAENCDGTAFTGADNNATYWESWSVQNGQISGRDKDFNVHDRWERGLCDVTSFGSANCPVYPKPTRGVWALAGTLYAYPNVDLHWADAHPMSGSRPSTRTEPTQDLGRPMARREIGGTWDDGCNSAPPTHTRL